MIFQEGHSGVVRLSDCLKVNVGNALETARQSVEMHRKHARALKQMRGIARRQLSNTKEEKLQDRNCGDKLADVAAGIPIEDVRAAIMLQGRLHAETFNVLLTACFVLESYINSLGFFLLRERDIIGLFRNSTSAAADALLEAVEKMSAIDKWQTIGKLKTEGGFDSSRSPYQDLKILFKFRNDHVHDKVTDWSAATSRKRYGGKLPETFGGVLDLSHAVYACDTYWCMVQKIHELVGVATSEFHGRYNLSTWFDKPFEQEVRKTASVTSGISEA